ncbi:UPF0561 protein C2orf68 homolog [Bolinopsis microptera]|uniref:UPF0561 protein C2orf68 homolog n=1 Tax=Bolinopsis microptera TaxID=2820187 RepID=UPI003079E23B
MEESQHKPRLDKNHGFLHHIKRNQIDRRDYHEEKLKGQVKEDQSRNKDRHDRRSRDDRRNRGRSRDDRRSTDRFTAEQNKKEYMDKPDKEGVVFTLSIEYCPDKVAVLKVRQRDDPDTLAKAFTKQYGMREDLTLALTHTISQRMGLK